MPKVNKAEISPTAPTSEPAPNDAGDIGARIRLRRQTLGLTLGYLSEVSGLSTGALSQIERGLVSPTVRTLYTIAEVLSMSPAQLIDPQGFAAAARANPYVLRAGEQPEVLNAGGVIKHRASPELIETMKSFAVRIIPGGSSGEECYTHSGEELGYVISGSFTLQIEDAQYLLSTGDGFALPSMTRHRFFNNGEAEAFVLWVNKPE
ncbi:cupin domain-containing protein [Brucella anthropi]|uniref:cupin domain-containing protein n=1 Tax=Brucella anthropi TaxID=529 RepID=UPI0021573CE1|nr:cupin domain-containing protein [Brucella anthropi]MCR8492393.1 cupin domain-containing protein [Brucella anthropi]